MDPRQLILANLERARPFINMPDNIYQKLLKPERALDGRILFLLMTALTPPFFTTVASTILGAVRPRAASGITPMSTKMK